MKQLIEPNLGAVGQPLNCERYTEDVFGVPTSGRHEADAFGAWEDAKYKHPDETPPADVSVPIYFNWSGNVDGIYKNWGHACVWDKGTIYTDPLHGEGHVTYPSIGAIQKAYGLGSYLGWTEDIENLRVVEEEDMFNDGDRFNINISLFGEDKGFWKDKVNQNLSYKDAVEQILDSPEFLGEQYLNEGDVVNIAGKTGWPKEENIKGWLWKRMWYDYAANKVQPPQVIDDPLPPSPAPSAPSPQPSTPDTPTPLPAGQGTLLSRFVAFLKQTLIGKKNV